MRPWVMVHRHCTPTEIRPLRAANGPPGKRMKHASWPASLRLATNRFACVVFPHLSTPSNRINAPLLTGPAGGASASFVPAMGTAALQPLLAISEGGDRWCRVPTNAAAAAAVVLPPTADAAARACRGPKSNAVAAVMATRRVILPSVALRWWVQVQNLCSDDDEQRAL